MEVQPELIICYLELKFNTYDNSEPYYFDADSVMMLSSSTPSMCLPLVAFYSAAGQLSAALTQSHALQHYEGSYAGVLVDFDARISIARENDEAYLSGT